MPECPMCHKVFKLLSRHTSCKPPPYVKAIPVKIVLPPNPLIKKIKQMITYDSKWTPQQVDETVSYLVQSLMVDTSKERYPIKLDEITELLEYTRLQGIELLLLENFKKDLDYSLLTSNGEQNKIKKVGSGGHNKKNYVLTITCAKQLCMLSSTKKAKSFRMYFIIIEDLLKKIIKDDSNKLVNNVRQNITNEISLTEKFEKIKLEINLEYDYKDKSVIYFHKLDTESDQDIYKWGITYRIGQRGEEHKKRFGNTTLIDVIDIDHLTYKQGFDLETSIRMVCKKLNIYYPYENSIETFRIKKTDDVNIIIDYIKEQSKKQNITKMYLPEIVTIHPPYRRETANQYKKRLEHCMGSPIKIKTFNYLMNDNGYDDLYFI
jgi:phage anti-repressor protein